LTTQKSRKREQNDFFLFQKSWKSKKIDIKYIFRPKKNIARCEEFLFTKKWKNRFPSNEDKSSSEGKFHFPFILEIKIQILREKKQTL
jgi:hypothetical protein